MDKSRPWFFCGLLIVAICLILFWRSWVMNDDLILIVQDQVVIDAYDDRYVWDERD